MGERDDFQQWENESKEFVVINRSLQLAQELQQDLFRHEAEEQAQMGVMALQMLAEMHRDVRGKAFYMHVLSALAIFDTPPERHIRSYGEMIIDGAVGSYGMSRLNNQHMLMLRVYEPKQKKVWNDTDVIGARLPVPLSVPVFEIESIFDKNR